MKVSADTLHFAWRFDCRLSATLLPRFPTVLAEGPCARYLFPSYSKFKELRSILIVIGLKVKVSAILCHIVQGSAHQLLITTLCCNHNNYIIPTKEELLYEWKK